MVGSLTNSREWIFASYNMLAEFEKEHLDRKLKTLNTRTETTEIQRLCKRQRELHAFEYTQTYEAFTFKTVDDEKRVEFKPREFLTIYKILQGLRKVFIADE